VRVPPFLRKQLYKEHSSVSRSRAANVAFFWGSLPV
jgi:hypothetical protein